MWISEEEEYFPVLSHGSRTVPGCGFPPFLLRSFFFSFASDHQTPLLLQDLLPQISLPMERYAPLHHGLFAEFILRKFCFVAEILSGKILSKAVNFPAMYYFSFFFCQREIWSWVNSKHVRNKKEMRGIIRAEMFGQLTSGLESAWSKLKGEGFFFLFFLIFRLIFRLCRKLCLFVNLL